MTAKQKLEQALETIRRGSFGLPIYCYSFADFWVRELEDYYYKAEDVNRHLAFSQAVLESLIECMRSLKAECICGHGECLPCETLASVRKRIES